MSTLQQSHDVDLESASCNNGGGGSGHRQVGAAVSEGGEPHFADANEIVRVVENKNNNSNNNDKHDRRESSVSECSVEIADLEAGAHETKLHLANTERDCRICHLSMDAANQDSGIPIELGCSCKDDLAAAHKQCAEAWFKIKGNKICEICGSIAQNVAGVTESELTEQWNETSDAAAAAMTSAPVTVAKLLARSPVSELFVSLYGVCICHFLAFSLQCTLVKSSQVLKRETRSTYNILSKLCIRTLS